MISEVCTKPAVTVEPATTILEAARLMRTKNIGALVVTNSSRPSGILTDRDIAVSVVAMGKDPATVTVGEVMHKNPTVIREDQGIFDVAKMFGTRGVRRLPVVSKSGQVTGMIALDDLLMLLGREMSHVASALSRGLARRQAA